MYFIRKSTLLLMYFEVNGLIFQDKKAYIIFNVFLLKFNVLKNFSPFHPKNNLSKIHLKIK